jgi:hypothetical protein
MVFVITVFNIYTLNLFNSNELDTSASQSIDHKEGVRDMFNIMRTTLSMFKILTHFNLSLSLKTYVFWWYHTFDLLDLFCLITYIIVILVQYIIRLKNIVLKK